MRKVLPLLCIITACSSPQTSLSPTIPQQPDSLPPSQSVDNRCLEEKLLLEKTTPSKELPKTEDAAPRSKPYQEACELYKKALAAAHGKISPNRKIYPYTDEPSLVEAPIWSIDLRPEIHIFRDGLRIIHHLNNPLQQERFKQLAVSFFIGLGLPFLDETEKISHELKDYRCLIKYFEDRGDYQEAARYCELHGWGKRSITNYLRDDGYVPPSAVSLARSVLTQKTHPRDQRRALACLERRALNTKDKSLFLESARAARDRAWWALAIKNYARTDMFEAGLALVQNDARRTIEGWIEQGELSKARRASRIMGDYELETVLERLPRSRKDRSTSCSRYDR